MTSVLSARLWKNNADMMADVAKLWIKPDYIVYDPTYGKGGFWKTFRPRNLVFDDLNPEKGFGGDFRNMRHSNDLFDVVVFDPAYVTPGGRDTSTIQVMNKAYGMDTTKISLAEQWEDIKKGMSECVRVSNGIVMQKCMNYISSGSYHNYIFDVTEEMMRLGLTIVDQFYFVRPNGGPQPKDRTRKCADCRASGCNACDGTGRVKSEQQHAVNNLSVLIVGQK